MVEFLCRKVSKSKRMVKGIVCRKLNSKRNIEVKLRVKGR